LLPRQTKDTHRRGVEVAMHRARSRSRWRPRGKSRRSTREPGYPESMKFHSGPAGHIRVGPGYIFADFLEMPPRMAASWDCLGAGDGVFSLSLPVAENSTRKLWGATVGFCDLAAAPGPPRAAEVVHFDGACLQSGPGSHFDVGGAAGAVLGGLFKAPLGDSVLHRNLPCSASVLK
jgi:hypothetical protein